MYIVPSIKLSAFDASHTFDIIQYCSNVLISEHEDPRTTKNRTYCWRRMLNRLKESHGSSYLSEQLIDEYLSSLKTYKCKGAKASRKHPAYCSVLILKTILFCGSVLPKEIKCLLDVPLSPKSPLYTHLQWLNSYKQLSPCTLAHKRKFFRKFEQYLKVNNIKYDNINTHTLRDFYKVIRATLPYMYNGNHDLNVLFKWMLKQGIVSKDLRPFVGKVKYKRSSIPAPLSVECLKQLWDSLEQSYSFCGLRTRAALGLLIATGMRITDLANLKFSNFEWGSSKACIHFKTHKTQHSLAFDIPVAIANAVYRYISQDEVNKESPYVFQSIAGDRISPRTLSMDIHKIIKRCNLTCEHGSNSAHRVRASIATVAANNSVPDYVISSILGHSSSESLSYYVTFNTKELRKCCLEIEPIKGGMYSDIKLKEE